MQEPLNLNIGNEKPLQDSKNPSDDRAPTEINGLFCLLRL
jgi:hypothetical protein